VLLVGRARLDDGREVRVAIGQREVEHLGTRLEHAELADHDVDPARGQRRHALGAPREDLELDLFLIAKQTLRDGLGEVDVEADQLALRVLEAKADGGGAGTDDQLAAVENALEAGLGGGRRLRQCRCRPGRRVAAPAPRRANAVSMCRRSMVLS